MRSLTIATAFFALAAVAATAVTAAPRLVYRIDSVSALVIRGHLVVVAKGAVKTGGWTNPRLHMKEVHIPESDAEVYEFLATPPHGSATVIQALLPMTATAVFPLPRYGAVKVIVQGEANSVTAPIETKPPKLEKPMPRIPAPYQ